MIIEIEGKTYLLKVKETHMTTNKDLVDEWIPLDEWSDLTRKKAVSTLYFIEETLSEFIGKPIRLSENYPELKKPLLDLNGSIGRLPTNLIVELVGDENG